jgi:hypothetical protein
MKDSSTNTTLAFCPPLRSRMGSSCACPSRPYLPSLLRTVW